MAAALPENELRPLVSRAWYPACGGAAWAGEATDFRKRQATEEALIRMRKHQFATFVAGAGSVLVVGLGAMPVAAAQPSSARGLVTSIGGALNGVSADSASDAWAVGSAGTSALTLHWNGTSWTRVPSPSPSSRYNALFGVSAVSGSDAWAVGAYVSNTTGHADTLILHWNGTSWSKVASPSPGHLRNYLYSVSAVSGNDAWAVGYYTKHGLTYTLILRWNGTSWTQVPSPGPSGAPVLRGVSAVSGSDPWAAGELGAATLILHWNGTSWAQAASPGPSPGPNLLFGVSAVPGSDAWAAGCASNTAGDCDTLILHWNGTSWTRQASPDPDAFDNQLSGVSAVSGADAWAAGHAGNDTLILHWNGTSWTRQASPSPSSSDNVLSGVSAVSGRDAWAAGSYRNNTTGATDTLILHWNGTSWSRW
jgi:hypothetical protein